ncbi:MAG: LTA synthase family protein [Bacteroidales bacterium]|nr:LTA synthase family protein [Bacteroidales bacterium]
MMPDVKDIFQRFARLTLAFLPVVAALRVIEYFMVRHYLSLPTDALSYELAGMFHDLFLFLFAAGILIVPFFLVALLSRRLAAVIYLTFLTILALINMALVRYFITTVIPLDQVLFSYNFDEMLLIVRNSTRVNLWSFFPFFVVVAAIGLFQYLFRSAKLNWTFLCLFFLLLGFSTVHVIWLTPGQKSFARDVDFFLQANKLGYFTKKILLFKADHNTSPDEALNEEALRNFRRIYRDFEFAGNKYPLLHKNVAQDPLGGFLKLSDRKPNIVILIMESLSPNFCGPDPKTRPFMPFLDSLIVHSLYWENFLATSERTFYVLPALLGSLPYSKEVFLGSKHDVPYHSSLIKQLNKQGYYSSFYYGGDPRFNNMEFFLNEEGTNYILKGFPDKYRQISIAHSGYSWGYTDGDMFNRSFEIIDSLNRNPRLDIYLTLSLHPPFLVPDYASYSAAFDSIVSNMALSEQGRNEMDKNRSIFTTLLYTDQALRDFFREYRKRPDFSNTIFIITGDHAPPEFGQTTKTPLEKYHVPLIIYSPLLTRAAAFKSVSSHLDVAPSLLNLLENRYQLTSDPLVHWMGKGLDTAREFRNTNAVSFVLNNKELVEYLHNDYFLSCGRLYKLLPGLDLEFVDKESRTETMEQELQDHILVTEMAALTNTFVSERIYFGDNLVADEDTIAELIELPDSLNQDEFLGIALPVELSKPYRYFDLDIFLRYKTDAPDSTQLPKLVIDIKDENFRNYFWEYYDLTGTPNNLADSLPWSAQVIRKRVDFTYLNALNGKLLKLYFWNPYRVGMKYDSTNFIIKGYYQSLVSGDSLTGDSDPVMPE